MEIEKTICESHVYNCYIVIVSNFTVSNGTSRLEIYVTNGFVNCLKRLIYFCRRKNYNLSHVDNTISMHPGLTPYGKILSMKKFLAVNDVCQKTASFYSQLRSHYLSFGPPSGNFDERMLHYKFGNESSC